MKKSKEYVTPIGKFTFVNAPLPYYSFGIQRVQLTSRQFVLMASPEKALCDKIIATSGIVFRSKQQVMDFLTEDMRIDIQLLTNFNKNAIAGWLGDAPKRSSLEMLLKILIGL
ncbi:hypothetical protein [Niabella hibiscisoli]|uniref:hypothetical protein n=1 Tax=Niabella hibiscisoli TaxID=1825928 RepID=UPI001F0F46F2|nr:hypothetical protein [Niabella hibiscisoli]MCH5719211.1 hypothetical protein [Niabella hibiscisoli]